MRKRRRALALESPGATPAFSSIARKLELPLALTSGLHRSGSPTNLSGESIGFRSSGWLCVDGPGTCLVLKTNQPSICRGISTFKLWNLDECYDLRDLPYNEGWVYRRFLHYQGFLLIPYLFGLSVVVTPYQKDAFILVFEFIPGLTVRFRIHIKHPRLHEPLQSLLCGI
ncbi:hypothetical protein B0H12DRAFT_332334 [Mycena haematopus]|nr:hypothetical protein B0H12DRAFT_332334 [Mycena haematopus]